MTDTWLVWFAEEGERAGEREGERERAKETETETMRHRITQWIRLTHFPCEEDSVLSGMKRWKRLN